MSGDWFGEFDSAFQRAVLGSSHVMAQWFGEIALFDGGAPTHDTCADVTSTAWVSHRVEHSYSHEAGCTLRVVLTRLKKLVSATMDTSAERAGSS